MKKALITQHAPLANDRVKDFVGERRYFATGSVSDNGSFTPELVTYASRPSRADLAVRRGDVCFARMQGTKKIFEVNPTIEDAILSTGFAVLRPNPEILDAKFLQSWINTEAFQSAKDRLCSGATQKAITNAKIKTLQIPLPPLAEQKRIAAILDAADALRTKRRESLEQLDTLLQSTFLEMFGDPVTNPMGWEITTLGERFDLRNGVNFAAEQKGRGILTVDVKNMYSGGVLVDTSSVYRVAVKPNEEQILRMGDILFVRSSVKREGVGWACAFRPQDEQVTFCGFIIRARPLSDRFESMFLVYYFRQGHVREQLISSAGQVAITNINQVNLGRLPIPIPPLDLQNRFASIVESVEQQKATQRQHLKELDTLFAALQQRAFNGELTT